MKQEPIPGRRAERKRDRRRVILDIAERSFIETGFAATSMSGIAAELGGSKTTLWSHFRSKEELFAAMLEGRVAEFAGALDEALIPGGGTSAALTRFGRVFLAKILSPDACALRRLVAAERERFPAIAQMFYDSGPARVLRRLATYMADEMEDDRLRAGDPLLAARQFIALCQAGAFSDIVWHRVNAPAADPAGEVEAAVAAFMRLWGNEEQG